MMQIEISESYNEMSLAVANEVTQLVQNKKNAVLCFPSGDTPLGLFKILVELSKLNELDFSACTFIGLDEWLGMDEDNNGSCKYFIYTNLFKPLGLDAGKVHFFDAKSTDPAEECERIDSIVETLGGIDLMVLGIGMNGHLGLNEPGINVELYSHIVELDSVTKVVGQKYFLKETHLQKGITLGMKHIMEARRVILMANGAKKAEIVKRSVEGEITNLVPASLIRNHSNAIIYLDLESSQKLNSI